jgi:hypothetical protein
VRDAEVSKKKNEVAYFPQSTTFIKQHWCRCHFTSLYIRPVLVSYYKQFKGKCNQCHNVHTYFSENQLFPKNSQNRHIRRARWYNKPIKSKTTITGSIIKIKLLQELELQRRIDLWVVMLRMFTNMMEFQQHFMSLLLVKVRNGLIFQFINLEHDFTSESSQRN